ncbi:MAG: hypothetical protein DMG60_22330 [Acidobacteria bacterium]|nr:MAG: hypothetical protein DMG60_22330 [Acidobacteriota bacterium]
MECYSEQIISLFVDGELEVEEAQRLRDHLATCWRCAQLLDALRAENRVLSESLQELPEESASPAISPGLRWSLSWRDVAIVAALLALGSKVAVWIDKVSIPQALQWLNPFSLSGGTNLFFNLSYYFAHGGAAMLGDYAAVVGERFLLLLLVGGALLLGRRWWLYQPGLRLLIVLLALSLPGFALERRHTDLVTVAANETIAPQHVCVGAILACE